MQTPYGDVITATATVTAAIAGVIIANGLTYRRSNKERLWDLRRETYGIILSELAAVEQICDGIDEAASERSYLEYWNTKGRERDDAEISDCMSRARKRYTADYLVLSDGFIKAFDELTADMRGDPYNFSPPEEHDSFSAAIRKHRPQLLALAHAEMKIEAKWWKLLIRYFRASLSWIAP
jgi:hypothetical protein